MKPLVEAQRPIYNDGPAGMILFGQVAEPEHELLRTVLAAARRELGPAWAASAAKREIFWINLWQRSGGAGPMALEGVPALDRWTRTLADRVYAGEGATCDGYGFIINPVGSRAQHWHIDYTRDYSTIFIPLSRLTTQNCTQYAVLPPNVSPAALAQATANLDRVDFDTLAAVCDYVSVRQLLAPPGAIIRMDFGTIHRGVANTGDFERVMFWISVKRGRELLPVEPIVEVIH